MLSSVYLSAVHIIDRKFCGKRSVEDMKTYSKAMTNFWPYLRVREDEATIRQRMYAQSFLQNLASFRRINSISPHLWGSPDHERQATIAVR